MKLEKDKKWKWPAENMREWTDEELENNRVQFGQQLLRLRFQLVGGQGDVLPVMRQLRKGIARVRTVQRERTLKLSAQKEV
ncbi:MAG: 50S ribosomal protein L29 [Acidobacteria bacterium]|nr:50S ribosomal protein L29 [Acidobacteriota bacterium]